MSMASNVMKSMESDPIDFIKSEKVSDNIGPGTGEVLKEFNKNIERVEQVIYCI